MFDITYDYPKIINPNYDLTSENILLLASYIKNTGLNLREISDECKFRVEPEYLYISHDAIGADVFWVSSFELHPDILVFDKPVTGDTESICDVMAMIVTMTTTGDVDFVVDYLKTHELPSLLEIALLTYIPYDMRAVSVTNQEALSDFLNVFRVYAGE